jgi:hypothetical protein
VAGEHSVLSPSKGEMITSCAAALGASKGVVDVPSKYAAEGTAYHELASRILEACRGYKSETICPPRCDDAVGQTFEADGFNFVIDDENAAHAQRYVDNIRALGGVQFYEQRLDTSHVVGVPGQGGTTDAVILDFENSTIRIRDLKFGQRPVYAPNNKQYLQYGAAALFKYDMLHDWKFLEVGTEQPRINHFDTHTYTVDEVMAWIEENRPKFARAYHLYLHPEQITAADFNPTEKGCEWCPIRGSCAARNAQFMTKFPLVSQKPLIHMSNADLGEARTMVEKFEAWASSIKAEAHRRAVMQGEKLPGWKVVQGRKGNRKLNPAAQIPGLDGTGLTTPKDLIDAMVGEDAYEPAELKSPAELQKTLTKKRHDEAAIRQAVWEAIQPAITQADGALSLEREDTSKPEISTGMEFPIQEVQQ